MRRALVPTFEFSTITWASTGGRRVIFSMDAQVDYLVSELRNSFAGVQRVLENSSVSVQDASDEVVYNFEVPGAVLQGGSK